MLREFSGTHLPAVLSEVRRTLGDQACVVDVNCENGRVEVLACEVPVTVHPFRRPEHSAPLVRTAHEDPDPLAFGAAIRPAGPAQPAPVVPTVATRSRPADTMQRPHPVRPPIVALVGPTGAGKTTTLAKLATNPAAYGNLRVGIIGLDTYRVGAVEQLETYAELAGIQCEIAYDIADLDRALVQMVECDVILVDTPGRGPRQSEDLATVREWLRHLVPDEVHLALPASMMPHVMRRTMTQFASFGVTHTICTKLDECPVDARVFDVVAREGHAMRWYTDGQEVPDDLRSAADRMDVHVLEAWQQHSAAEIDDLCRSTCKLFGTLVRADVDDSAVIYGNRFRPGARSIDGIDAAVSQYQVGGWCTRLGRLPLRRNACVQRGILLATRNEHTGSRNDQVRQKSVRWRHGHTGSVP